MFAELHGKVGKWECQGGKDRQRPTKVGWERDWLEQRVLSIERLKRSDNYHQPGSAEPRSIYWTQGCGQAHTIQGKPGQGPSKQDRL